jgi:hypothetical protein
MRDILVASLVTMVASFGSLSTAHAGSKWQGTSTNPAGNFNYGKVTFTLDGKIMKNFIIKGVTTSGCGNYNNVVVPRINVQGTKFNATYVSIAGINDIIVVSGKFNGNKVTGSFSEGPLCSNAGKFSAKKK